MGGLHEWEQKEKINLLGVCLVSRTNMDQTSHVSMPKMLNMNHLADLAASAFTKTVPSPYSKSRF